MKMFNVYIDTLYEDDDSVENKDKYDNNLYLSSAFQIKMIKPKS